VSNQEPQHPSLDDDEGDEPLDLSNFGLVLERIWTVFKSEGGDGAAEQEKRDDEERMIRLMMLTVRRKDDAQP
jgi:hypothetical protein